MCRSYCNVVGVLRLILFLLLATPAPARTLERRDGSLRVRERQQRPGGGGGGGW
jgi:hypothetical protein